MKKALFRTLFGLSMLCVILCTALFGTIFYNGWKEDFHTTLLMEAKTIAALSELPAADTTHDRNASLLRLTSISRQVDPQLRLTWIAPNGQVYYDSVSDAATMENHGRRPEVLEALRTGEGSYIRHSSTLQDVNYYEAIRLSDGSVLRISRVGTTIYALLYQALPWMIAIFVAITALSYYVARRRTKYLIAPIERLAAAWASPAATTTLPKNGNATGVSAPNDTSMTAYEELAPLLTAITDQKHALEAVIRRLQSERNTLRFVIEEMDDGILLAEWDGTIVAYNERIRDFFTIRSPKSLHGRSLYELSTDAQWRRHLHRALVGHTPGEYKMPHEDRYFQVIFHVTDTIGKQGRVLIVITDITKEYLEQQRRAEFTSNVSHELRTPLTTIRGYSELLSQGLYKSSEDVTVLGSHIHKAAKHMSELIETILKLSRIEEGSRDISKETLVLDDIVNAAWAHLEGKRRGKSMTADILTGGLAVTGNRKLLEDVFINLFDNSIKFSHADGNMITVRAHRQGRSVLITVADRGIGIAPDKVSRIFERFYQTNESRNSRYEGSGLGLSLVKHIMDVHGGTVSVKSTLGEGTEFTLRLPAPQ